MDDMNDGYLELMEEEWNDPSADDCEGNILQSRT